MVMRAFLGRLSRHSFTKRHIGPSLIQNQKILETLKANSPQQIIQQVAGKILDPQVFKLDNPGMSQHQYLKYMRQLSINNQLFFNMIGWGYYGTLVPPVIQRNLFQNPGWYTSYTPYQAQISQGRLYSLIIYQTLIAQLTGLDISNASLLDQASSAVQSFYMAHNNLTQKRPSFFIHEGVFPQSFAAVKSTAKYLDINIITGSQQDLLKIQPKMLAGAIFQSPDKQGTLRKFQKAVAHLKADPKCLKILGSDLLALTLIKDAKTLGFDVCYGSSQRLGVPMGYGGPSAGFFACKSQSIRRAPGRIIGISKDKFGKQCYRMALQTRQQHIKRQKATSNICTAQALLANMTAMYSVYHGPQGLLQISKRIHKNALNFAQFVSQFPVKVLNYDGKKANFFDSVCIKLKYNKQLARWLRKNQINVNDFMSDKILFAFDQTTTSKQIKRLYSQIRNFFKMTPQQRHSAAQLDSQLVRDRPFMKQQVFNSITSQTQMMRFLEMLRNKDISLTKSMIPLGSCTLKLNSAAEMYPVSFNQFANLHPFVPEQQAKAYNFIISELEKYLCEVTGFDAMSFQPNSGAQGQYAGLLTIRQYQNSKGEGYRNICLIPKSAHGTNPASAVKAGLQVVTVEVKEGTVDMEDLKAKVQKYGKKLSALMITYPSTAGVFQSTIKQITAIVHGQGAQVYMDGANMNAQVGITSPGFLGADVCHLNLHKTFAIPHGGGGPGMGPIGVKQHLKPFLPRHPLLQDQQGFKGFTLSSAPFGSASILLISYGYIKMLGSKGMKDSTVQAILNANYLKSRLQSYYPILFAAEGCAHQFIIDIRPIKAATGVSQEDIAKRLMDYGFHSPTMSFPVAGTLMIEPTQSEDLPELDRFAEALIEIRKQIQQMPSLLKNAPHTIQFVMQSQWKQKYSRERAVFPLKWVLERGKYWPPVARIDGVYGDKNLRTVLK